MLSSVDIEIVSEKKKHNESGKLDRVEAFLRRECIWQDGIWVDDKGDKRQCEKLVCKIGQHKDGDRCEKATTQERTGVEIIHRRF